MTEAAKKPIGYSDTPIIPGSKWRVHDGNRPQPPVVTPGDFPTQDKAGTPPSDAVILFNGQSLSQWVGKEGQDAPWKVENGYFESVPRTGNIHTRTEFGDCQLHLEFSKPDAPGDGNSGVFMMRKYEIQILNCYDHVTYADGVEGGLYGQCPPLVNACLPRQEWSTYDIIWIAPRFAGEQLMAPAYITVFLNGVLLHHMQPLQGPTRFRALAEYKPQSSYGAIELQDHGDPVRFRNIWCRPLSLYSNY
jgi:hypothetical protein